jgi:hypothetical protein
MWENYKYGSVRDVKRPCHGLNNVTLHKSKEWRNREYKLNLKEEF